MVSRKEKKKEVKKDEPTLSYIQIFRYGTCLERFATMLGVALALVSGGGLCYNLAQFGELSTAMVERTTYQNQLSSRLPLIEAFGGGRRLMNATHEENMAALVQDATAAVAGMFASLAAAQALLVAAVALVNWSALRQMTRIRQLFLRAVLRQDMTWFDTDTEFNLAAKMTENMKQLKEGMGEKLAVVANLAGTALLSVCTALPLGWKLALACLSVVPFSITASVLLSNYQTKSSIKEMESYSQAGKQAEEVLKSVRTVVAFGGQHKEVERYRGLLAPAERRGRARGVYTGVGTGLSWLLTYSLNTIGLAYGTRLFLEDLAKPVDERTYQVGTIFAILFSVYMATQSITFCVPHGEAFAAARAAATNIFQLLENEPAIDSMSEVGSCPKRVLGDITLEDVHFSYPARPNVKVLQGVSIHVKRGECVALVGSSGCGKSTILQLLQRLYDPHIGSVKIDGKNIKNLKISWLRSILGVVGQEPVLFRGTIYENIAICCPDATREEVEAAAKMAFAHEFILNLAEGYETVIGERGASLSGGQKQRVAIARALLREPAVLLLDEATSALDPPSERQVQAALDKAREGRTTLVVSHRLSTIVNADRIICMDKGVIVEQGTHQELMKLQGMYYNLVISSHGGEEPDLIETFPEETEDEIRDFEAVLTSRLEVKRKSTRRVSRRHSAKRDSHDWMTPRGSISSVMSTGLQSFAYSADSEDEEDSNDEEEKVGSVSAWQLIKVNGPEWPLLTVGSIAAVAQGVCFPAFAILMGYSAGIFALPDAREIVNLADFYASMYVVVASVAGISMCLQSTAFTNSGLKLTSRLRQQYFDSLLKQEMGYFDKESNTVGAMCARLSGDTAEVQGATGLMIGLVLQGLSSVLVGFIMALCYSWKLALVGASFVPIMVGSTWLEGVVSQKSQAHERAAVEEATAVATEAVISIRTVQSLGIEKVFMEKFERALEKSCSAISKKNRWRGCVLGLGIYIPFVTYISALAYGTTLVAYEDLEYRIALLVPEATMYGAYALGQSLVYAPSFNSAKTCGARILALIRRQPKIESEPGLKDRKDWMASGNFSLKDVEFGYPTRPHQRVLRGIDLKVEAGKTVALVGSSGCGKSTILQLLQRFYDPDSGNIELDSRDIRSALTLPRLRRQLGVVQQEPVLFDRTLAENIAYGDNSRKLSMYEIVNAAKAANIHNFIVSLPKGYETNLGSCGAQLSGGQKQRVCIARALIRSPRLLLLDEATSALDASSERAVAEALEKAAKGRTCVTVAHRLCTIKDSDLICVLDKGKIVERGTHAELVETRGLYWKMCKGQNIA